MIEAVIDLMVAETNQAFEASGADLQVALSVWSEVPYEEVDAATDLSRLGDPSDGYPGRGARRTGPGRSRTSFISSSARRATTREGSRIPWAPSA